MSETVPGTDTPDSGAPDDVIKVGADERGGIAVLDSALWRDLMSTSDDAAFGQAWLGLAGKSIAGAGAAVLALIPGPARDPVVCAWPPGTHIEPALLKAAHAAMKGGRGIVQALPLGAGTHVAYPVQLDGTVVAAACFTIAPGPGRDPRNAMRQVQWAAAWLRDWRRRRDIDAVSRAAERTSVALELLAAVLEEDGFIAACRVSATELATRFGCERVAIGFSRRRVSSVVAISHTAQFGRTMSLVRLLAGAMDEAIDQHGPLLWPEQDGVGDIVVTRAHAALAADHGSSHILTIPMFVRDRFAGAVTFERGAVRPFDQQTVDLAEAVVAILGPAL